MSVGRSISCRLLNGVFSVSWCFLHYCSRQNTWVCLFHHCPCPPARDIGSCVSDLVYTAREEREKKKLTILFLVWNTVMRAVTTFLSPLGPLPCSLHFSSWSIQAGHWVPLTRSMCDPWMTSYSIDSKVLVLFHEWQLLT